jgi:hypothetical protein
MKTYYSKDFESQSITPIGKFESFDEADGAAGDHSDWIYDQDSIEKATKELLSANIDGFPVWVITTAIDYEVEVVAVYVSKMHAEERYIEIVNEEFDKGFSSVDECLRFICSDEWWDNDERMIVNLDMVKVLGEQ